MLGIRPALLLQLASEFLLYPDSSSFHIALNLILRQHTQYKSFSQYRILASNTKETSHRFGFFQKANLACIFYTFLKRQFVILFLREYMLY
jgi:hypothetical protein